MNFRSVLAFRAVAALGAGAPVTATAAFLACLAALRAVASLGRGITGCLRCRVVRRSQMGVAAIAGWRSGLVGSGRVVGATAALRSALAAAAFSTIIALTTLTISPGTLRASLGSRRFRGRGRGLRQIHALVAGRLAVGVHAVSLPWSGAFAPSPTAPAAAATPAVGTRLATPFRPALGTGFSAAGGVATSAVALVVARRLGLHYRRHHRRWGGSRGKQLLDPAKKAFFCRWCWRCWLRCRGRYSRRGGLGDGFGRFGPRRSGRCRRVGQHALDHGRLLVGRLLRAACDRRGVFNFFGHFVRGLDVVEPWVVVLEPLELVVGGFQGLVGHHQHIDALLELDFGDLGAFFIEQERGHLDRHLAQHRGRVVLERFFLDDAQDLQRARFSVANMTSATATWAGDGGAFAQRRAQPLPAHLHQAELADGAELHPGAVLPQRVAQPAFHLAPVAAFFHVNEVDHDQAAEVAQPHLARHFVGSLQVGAGGGLFDVAAANGARRVHVHRDQGLGVVNHNRAAAGQLHSAGIGRFDLVLDLETREQWRVIAVAFDAGRMLGHHVRHELLGLVVDVVGVDQDVADVVVEVVADGAYHQARFLVNQEGAFATLGRAVNGGPEFEQVVQVPLQFRRAAANAGGARNDAHAIGVFELVQRLLEVGPVFALDAA